MFTDNELKRVCDMVLFLRGMFPFKRLAQTFGIGEDELTNLFRKVDQYAIDDPRKPTSEVYGVITQFIEDNGENLLNNEGVDPVVAEQWTEQIMNEIKVRFELVDHETYKRLVSIVTQKKQ